MDIKDLKGLVQQLNAQNNKVKTLESCISEEKKVLENLKYQVLQVLDEHDLDTFESDDVKISKKTRLNVKMEDREKFFEYLKGNGIFEDLITVNSNTLNAWFRETLEAAVGSGANDLVIPGLAETSMHTSVQIRKKQ